MNRINNNNFDFLRIVFAGTVAIAHLIELSEVEIFQPYLVFFNTRLAINGFFIISGFLITKSYENSLSNREFIIKRIKRIVPAYFFIVLSCTFCFVLISNNSLSNYFFNIQLWKYLVANLTFQNYIEPCLPGVFEKNLDCAVNGSLWTIKVEEAFYLLVPLFFWMVNLKRINFYFLVVIIYLASVAFFNYYLALDAYRIAKQLPGAMAYFITGIVLYKNFYFFVKWVNYLILPCLSMFFLEQYIFKIHILQPVTYGLMVFYIAYNFKFLNKFGKFGDFTYGIYIIHFPIIQIFVHYGLFNKHNPIFVSMLVLIIVFSLAILSWYLIELPFLSKIRRARQKKLLLKV